MATERDLQITRETARQGTPKDQNLGVTREVVRSLFPTGKAQNLQVFREALVPFFGNRGTSGRRPQVWVIT